MPRLFFALWPERAARRALNDAALALDVREARRVAREDLHLTLCFVGETSAALAERLQCLSFDKLPAPFRCEVGRAGWWRDSQVAWLGLLEPSPSVDELHRCVTETVAGLGIAIEPRAFQPHITVARKVRRAPRATGAIAYAWQVKEFVLVESRPKAYGARYEVIHKWPLRGARGD